jgi:hypothetical protein
VSVPRPQQASRPADQQNPAHGASASAHLPAEPCLLALRPAAIGPPCASTCVRASSPKRCPAPPLPLPCQQGNPSCPASPPASAARSAPAPPHAWPWQLQPWHRPAPVAARPAERASWPDTRACRPPTARCPAPPPGPAHGGSAGRDRWKLVQPRRQTSIQPVVSSMASRVCMLATACAWRGLLTLGHGGVRAQRGVP